MTSDLDFEQFAKLVRSSDLFTMRHPTTPGLDVREGYEIMCIGDPVTRKNRYTGREETIVPVLYPDSIPYYAGSVRSIRSGSRFLFSITTKNEEVF